MTSLSSSSTLSLSQTEVAEMNQIIKDDYKVLNYQSVFEMNGIVCSQYALDYLRKEAAAKKKRKKKE